MEANIIYICKNDNKIYLSIQKEFQSNFTTVSFIPRLKLNYKVNITPKDKQ